MSALAPDLARYRPIACGACESVGTIVELGLCCRVQEWVRDGAMWELERRLVMAPPRRPHANANARRKAVL